ncbi:hypothetical protein PISMIDRAFT_680504 [Pisolithus microcarpus 441]|uniref:Uncharacterized protein n=1 Tax=Pisolithus microcarpus 441 TaxID=765257 RepID=A0A0C9YBQ8_9AGAM|nr:hypothetical protein PISMIDRAFT_680504 [Pisolithus microcarpus 441]
MDLAKRFGAAGSLSNHHLRHRTSSTLAAIKKHGSPTLSQDGFPDLFGTRVVGWYGCKSGRTE